MSHLDMFLPESVEIGAVKRFEWLPEIVTTDGGNEVRNQRRSRAKHYFDCAVPHSTRSGSAYLAVIQLFEDSLGGTYSFNLRDWTDDSGATVVKVRFDGELQITSPTPDLDHIDTFTLVEVFD